jgi:hypothetical protein
MNGTLKENPTEAYYLSTTNPTWTVIRLLGDLFFKEKAIAWPTNAVYIG